jgi:hypothetical protein
VSARVYVWPRGVAKVPRGPAASFSWGSDDVPPTPAEAAAWWRDQAQTARDEAARLSGEVLRALARAQSCDRFAARVEENSTCPPPRANEETGSPTCTEGDPDESA